MKQIDNNGNFSYFTLENKAEVWIPEKFGISGN